MMSYEMTWEDEDCNRNVQFSIGYQIEDSEVKIADVTPTAVSFLCRQTDEVIRTIGIHTRKGQQMLMNQFVSPQRMDEITNAIAEQNGLLVTA